MMRGEKIFLLIMVSGLINFVSMPARAETLSFDAAMRYVVSYHPAILAAQAQLRAADEQFAQAQAGWRPSLNAEGDLGWTDLKDDAFSNQQTTGVNRGGNVTLDQPLYRGGKTTAEINRARHLILAARATYAQTVQATLLRAGMAYADLVRDRTVLALNQQNAARLQTEWNAAQERFRGGDVTVGDVEQAQTRAARGNADAIRAQNNLTAAQAAYESAIGLPPADELVLLPASFQFPDTAAATTGVALNDNLDLFAAKEQALAAQEDVKDGYGDLLPQISAFASYDNQYQPEYGVVDHATTSSVGIRARLALYDGGVSRAHVRAQKDTAAQRQWNIDDLTAAVRADAVRQWQDWQSQHSIIAAAQSELEAAQKASDAVSAEAQIGTRPVVDVLDADQDLLGAQNALATAQHDEFTAALNLAATLGHLVPSMMGITDSSPDAAGHLRKTADKIFSLDPN